MSSTGISALTQVPTMSNVWLPRWFATKNKGVCEFHVVVFSFFRNDPFPQDILPTNVPSLLNELPESDRRQLLDEYV